MSETLIARTFAEGLRPLGAAAQRNHALITDAVAARLSPAHVLLFCEPVTTPDGVATDWYAQARGVVRRLDELGSQEGEAARRRLGALVGDILSIADEFEAGGSEADRRLAEALRNATEVPDGNAIWLVGDQPVLVTWSNSRDIDKTPRGIIRTFIPAKPPPPPQPAPDPVIVETREPLTFRDVLWWFGWLVLAVLVFWVFWLLVAPCALRGPGFLAIDACPSSLASEIRAETDQRAALEDRVAMLERDLARTGRACAQPVALQPPPELNVQLEPPEEEPSDVVETVMDEGGEIGAVNVILSWQGTADLDLWVECPSGMTITHANRQACGGELDTDANHGPAMDSPVENIVFADAPESGSYKVTVDLFGFEEEASDSVIPFTVVIIIDGEETVHNGSLDMDNRRWFTDFEIGGS